MGATTYAPYGGPIQIQSNALRAIQRINPTCYEELVKAGTVTADRVSGLKIGYRKGNLLAGLYDAGDWLGRFDTIGPALEADLPATVVVDRPVIQQILVKHGFPEGTVRIGSRVQSYEELGPGGGVEVTLEDGSRLWVVMVMLMGTVGILSRLNSSTPLPRVTSSVATSMMALHSSRPSTQSAYSVPGRKAPSHSAV